MNTYKKLLNFKGFGNPNGNIWFIGSEENWNPLTDNESFHYYEKEIQPFNSEEFCHNRSRFYKGIYQLYDIISSNNNLIASLDQFGSSCFVSNFFHIGRRSREYPNPEFFERYYLRPLGITYKSYERDIESRMDILRGFWNEKKQKHPQLVFCLSKMLYRDFLNLFQLEVTVESIKVPEVRMIDQHKIYFLYHPASRGSYWNQSLKFVRNNLDS